MDDEEDVPEVPLDGAPEEVAEAPNTEFCPSPVCAAVFVVVVECAALLDAAFEAEEFTAGDDELACEGVA